MSLTIFLQSIPPQNTLEAHIYSPVHPSLFIFYG